MTNVNSDGAGGGPTSRAGVASVASETTRNFILGLPKNGPAPGSGEAASLQAAEAFVGQIQQEIMAYDMANARAMEAYAQSCWRKVPFFGRRWSRQNKGGDGPSENPPRGSHETRGHCRVERTSAGPTAVNAGRINSWLFKQRRPGWVPLIQRWWVPCVCAAGIVLIWTPDVWKLRALYWCDHQYARLRREIHKAYWRASMSAEDYEELMRDLELQRPTSIKATKCPL